MLVYDALHHGHELLRPFGVQFVSVFDASPVLRAVALLAVPRLRAWAVGGATTRAASVRLAAAGAGSHGLFSGERQVSQGA